MRGSSATQYLQELYARYAGPAFSVAVAPHADHIDYTHRSYGHFQTSNSYFICADPAKIDAIFDRLRHFPGENVSPTHAGAIYPQTIGGLRIRSTRDLTTDFGYDSSSPPTFAPSLPLSGGHMITFRAGDAITDGAAITLTVRWVQSFVSAASCLLRPSWPRPATCRDEYARLRKILTLSYLARAERNLKSNTISKVKVKTPKSSAKCSARLWRSFAPHGWRRRSMASRNLEQ